MATTWDYINFILTFSVFGGIIFGLAYAVRVVKEGIEKNKADMKARGYTFDKSGLAIKTNRRLDREHYLDATQRRIMGLSKHADALSFGDPAQREAAAKKWN